MDKESRGISLLMAALPYAVLAVYAYLIAAYSKYLDWNLNYRVPAVPRAPEDVLGLGFWVPWAIVSLLFVFSLLTALVSLERRARFALILVALFAALSILDFCLYQTLERQVLGL